MAHNLYEKLSGKVAMAYHGDRPWHGLGIELEKPATAHEAIAVAGLDYEVSLQPLYTTIEMPSGPNIVIPVHNHNAVVNRENNQTLGVVGRYYKVIQNREAFNFFDSVVGQGKAFYHTCGALGRGERIWIVAKLPADLMVANHKIEPFLTLMTGHDGNTPLKMWFSPINTVCQNTLIASLRHFNTADGVTVRHSGDINSKVRAAQQVLQIALGFYEKFEETANTFLAHQIKAAEIEEFLSKLVPDESMSEDAVEEARLSVGFLAQEGRGQKGNTEVQGSAWAYYQGATEYADYYRKGMGINVDRSKKLASKWFGSSARFKARAFSLLGDLVGIN